MRLAVAVLGIVGLSRREDARARHCLRPVDGWDAGADDGPGLSAAATSSTSGTISASDDDAALPLGSSRADGAA